MRQEFIAEHSFIQISAEEFYFLIESGLTKSGIKLYLRLKFKSPFGDRLRVLPNFIELAQELGISEDTIRREFNKLVDLGFIIVDSFKRFVSVFKSIKIPGNKSRSKNFYPKQNCKKNCNSDNSDAEMQSSKQNCENQQLEPPLDKDCESSQTLQTDQTSQTGEDLNLLNKKKTKENESCSKQKLHSDHTLLPNHVEKTGVPRRETSKKYNIPSELAERLRECRIPVSEQVLNRISKHHISQAYGAITHVENTWATINDAKAVFLYQLPKQPIEKLGQRYSDELLERQKREQKRIDEERKQPEYLTSMASTLSLIKEKLLSKQKKDEIEH